MERPASGTYVLGWPNGRFFRSSHCCNHPSQVRSTCRGGGRRSSRSRCHVALCNSVCCLGWRLKCNGPQRLLFKVAFGEPLSMLPDEWRRGCSLHRWAKFTLQALTLRCWCHLAYRIGSFAWLLPPRPEYESVTDENVVVLCECSVARDTNDTDGGCHRKQATAFCNSDSLPFT